MLLREDDRGILAIGQQSHAWLSGQLARAWGNERFGSFEPREEVCLAAEQHDAGWAERDLDPLCDPATGRPLSFMEMPLDVHLAIWTEGPRRLLSQSRYAALLVSMHGWRLYERRDLGEASPADAAAIKAFLAEQLAFQRDLLAQLRAEPAQVERNSRLIWTWDYLSLAVCLNWDPATAKGCPSADGPVDVRLVQSDREGGWQMDPWPFQLAALSLRCEGRRLGEPTTAVEALELVLRPA